MPCHTLTMWQGVVADAPEPDGSANKGKNMFNKKKRIEELEAKVKRLGCKHDDWMYEIETSIYTNKSWYTKTCERCGEREYLPYDQWCQEQADKYYKLHEHWIDMLNKPEPDVSSEAGSVVYYTP